MKKICIINQPEGLGDILYIQKIGCHFQDQGYEIYWPVNPAYCNIISNYLTNFKYFCNSLDGFLGAGLTADIHNTYLEYPGQRGLIHEQQFGDSLVKFVPTNHLQEVEAANPEVMPNPGHMQKRKYAFVGVSDHDWPDYLHIKRNSEKENELYYNVLNIQDNEPYALVNVDFGTPGMMSHWGFILQNFLHSDSGRKGLRPIKLKFIDGFSLFDWCKVFENAKEIWMEGSAATWMCEKLTLKADTLKLYCRWGHNHPELHHHFSHPWHAARDFTNDGNMETFPIPLRR